MIDLIIAMSCSAAIALLFKFSENKQLPRTLVTAFNYLVGTLISVFLLTLSPIKLYPINVAGLAAEIPTVLSNQNVLLSPQSSMLWSIIIGMITGILFLTNFLYYQKSVKCNGAGLSGTFQKMGIVIPVIIAIFAFKEYPTIVQWLGILLSFVVILVLQKGNRQKVAYLYLLLILFIMGGFSEFTNKIFQQYALDDYRTLFLLTVFLTALISSSLLMIQNKVKIRLLPCAVGTLIGIANYGSSYFLIQSLSQVKSSLAFPIFSVGSLVMIIVFSRLIYREILTRREYIALAIAMTALVLMNLG